MTQVEKVSVALTAELAEEVREAVRRGEYASSSEVVREALRDWSFKREGRAAAIARFRQLCEEGLASGEPQERQPLEDFLMEAHARLAKMRGA
jgi:antitoxin ParD1/3/4